MSIAVHVQTRQSVAGFYCMAAVAAIVFFAAALALSQCVSQQDMRAAFGVICCVGTGIALTIYNYRLHCMPQSGLDRVLDISVRGTLRLWQGGHEAGDGQPLRPMHDCRMQLMAGSTLWPCFILLRLRPLDALDARGGAVKKTVTLAFFPHRLAPGVFRRLSVGCRWIAARERRQAGCEGN